MKLLMRAHHSRDIHLLDASITKYPKYYFSWFNRFLESKLKFFAGPKNRSEKARAGDSTKIAGLISMIILILNSNKYKLASEKESLFWLVDKNFFLENRLRRL